ncbi:MAG: DNA-binding beta-propeller fold protein YncE [Myxococcota bacterium]|jgi:DNA-binding beta-propeller fold protein YncE
MRCLLPCLLVAAALFGASCTDAADAPILDESVEDTTSADAIAPTPDQGTPAADEGTPTPDEGTPPLGPCEAGDSPMQRSVLLPLGETLFLDGDDYLAFLDDGEDCDITLTATPDQAGAVVVEDSRLTPDRVGDWVLTRGNVQVTVVVADDTLSSDTFQNYNYTPVLPLVALADGAEALVACPTSNAVQHVDLVAGSTKALIPTGSWPTSVVLWGDYALVAQTGRDSLGFLRLSDLILEDAILVGNEPAGIAVNGDEAYVTLSGENKVVRIDLNTRKITGSVETGHDPRSLVLSPDGSRLYVASLMSFNEHRFGLNPEPTELELQRDITLVDTANFERLAFIPEVATMTRGLWISPDGSRLIAAVSHSNNDGASIDADSQPHSHGLAVIDFSEDGDPLTWEITQIDLDYRDGSAGPAASPFTMALTPDGSQLVVTLSASRSLLFLNAETLAEEGRVLTGNDPRGLLFAQGRIWTNSWLDNQLEGIVPPTNVLGPPDVVAMEVGLDPTPMVIRQGQRMFNDAGFSKHGDFSCNNCHIDGLTDGLVWDLLVDGSVNTLAFRNVAGTDPFLWGGQLPTLFDFSREVLRLVGAEATGQEMEFLTLYMQSITAPPNPYTRPGGKLTAAGELGKAIFEAPAGEGGGGCAACHNGPLFTNRTAVPGKTEGKITDVPGLIGVYDTPPFGREGQWASLEAIVAYAVEYTGGELNETELASLLDYVRQIPGDALWLNAARPLSGSDHVWVETPIELTFSHLVSPGQEELFSMVTLATDDEGAVTETAVEGEWTLSGRIARFDTGGALPHDTAYKILVDPGLEGTLGQVLRAPLDVTFTTGGEPLTDVSGKWMVTLEATKVPTLAGLISFDPQAGLSLIQATGGNLTGVIESEAVEDFTTLSHLEGVVSGNKLVLEPFLFDTDFGEIQVHGGFADLIDEDGDGFADSGVGSVTALSFVVPWHMERISLPGAGQ